MLHHPLKNGVRGNQDGEDDTPLGVIP